MYWYRNLNFRNKLMFPSIVIMVVVVGSALLNIFNVADIEQRAQLLATEYLPNQDFLLQADKDIVQVQSAERSMLFLNPSSEQFTKQKHLQTVNLQQTIERLSKINSKNQQLLTLKTQAVDKFRSWKAKTLHVTSLLESDTARAQQQAVELSFNQVNQEFWSIRSHLDELLEIIINSKNSAVVDIDVSVTATHSSLVISMILTVVTGFFLIFVLPTMVTRSINILQQSLSNITRGERDLTQRLVIDSEDELGALAIEFNLFLSNLQDIIQQVSQVTQRVLEETKVLASSSQQAQVSLEQQKLATESVTEASEVMATDAQQVANHAQTALDRAQHADEKATDSQKVIQQTVATINLLSDNITDAKESVTKVAEDSLNIGSVLEVIKSIAEQTNLLALNAAIEAARAGEQGRGFAVVADEVRALAVKTQQSTEQIRTMIEALQLGSQHAVTAITSGSQQVVESVSVVNNANETLNDIKKSVDEIQRLNNDIAQSAVKNRQMTDGINRNLGEIAASSDHNLDTAKTVGQSGHKLSELSKSLSDLVLTFKV